MTGTVEVQAPQTIEEATPAGLPTYRPGLDLRATARGGGAAVERVRRDAVALLDRLLQHHRDGTTDQADAVMRQPVDSYLDADLWRREIDTIHKRVPLALALSCELPTPGSYKAVDVADVPVVITRDRSGVLHAMVNACRHRGSPVVSPGTGQANRLTCPYHAWSYDLAGCLRGVYGESTFGELDRGDRSLLALPVEERAGIVFVGLTPGLDLSLDSWLGDLEPLLAGLGLADLHHHSTREVPGTNYKVILDGYLETYHFASLHASTVALTNVSNMIAFDTWGPHMRNAAALRAISEEADKPAGQRDPAKAVAPNYWLFPGMAIAGGYRHVTAVSFVLPGRTPMESMTQQVIGLRRGRGAGEGGAAPAGARRGAAGRRPHARLVPRRGPPRGLRRAGRGCRVAAGPGRHRPALRTQRAGRAALPPDAAGLPGLIGVSDVATACASGQRTPTCGEKWE